jgi:hypothetical protein
LAHEMFGEKLFFAGYNTDGTSGFNHRHCVYGAELTHPERLSDECRKDFVWATLSLRFVDDE